MQGNVSLIVTTYNRPEALNAVLRSIQRQSIPPHETIIVDDGSDAHTEKIIAQYNDNIRNLRHIWQEDQGFRAGRVRNLGIAFAQGDYLIFVDGDMILHPQFVVDHIKQAQKGQFIQGTRITLGAKATERYLHNPFTIRFYHFNHLKRIKYSIRSVWLSKLFSKNIVDKPLRIHGCNQSFWKQDLLRVNGFDERYHEYSGEDGDICARLLASGIVELRLRFLALAFHLYHDPNANWSKILPPEHNGVEAALGVSQYLPLETLPITQGGKFNAKTIRIGSHVQKAVKFYTT